MEHYRHPEIPSHWKTAEEWKAVGRYIAKGSKATWLFHMPYFQHCDTVLAWKKKTPTPEEHFGDPKLRGVSWEEYEARELTEAIEALENPTRFMEPVSREELHSLPTLPPGARPPSPPPSSVYDLYPF